MLFLVPHTYGVGQTQAPQLPTMQGQATVAHAPPMVSYYLYILGRVFVIAFYSLIAFYDLFFSLYIR